MKLRVDRCHPGDFLNLSGTSVSLLLLAWLAVYPPVVPRALASGTMVSGESPQSAWERPYALSISLYEGAFLVDELKAELELSTEQIDAIMEFRNADLALQRLLERKAGVPSKDMERAQQKYHDALVRCRALLGDRSEALSRWATEVEVARIGVRKFKRATSGERAKRAGEMEQKGHDIHASLAAHLAGIGRLCADQRICDGATKLKAGGVSATVIEAYGRVQRPLFEELVLLRARLLYSQSYRSSQRMPVEVESQVPVLVRLIGDNRACLVDRNGKAHLGGHSGL